MAAEPKLLGQSQIWSRLPEFECEVFYIKFLQKYSSFNMYITSLLLLERAQYLCLQRKTGPSNVLEHCYKIFLLGRSKEQET